MYDRATDGEYEAPEDVALSGSLSRSSSGASYVPTVTDESGKVNGVDDKDLWDLWVGAENEAQKAEAAAEENDGPAIAESTTKLQKWTDDHPNQTQFQQWDNEEYEDLRKQAKKVSVEWSDAHRALAEMKDSAEFKEWLDRIVKDHSTIICTRSRSRTLRRSKTCRVCFAHDKQEEHPKPEAPRPIRLVGGVEPGRA